MRALLEGAAPTPELRAAAVGVPVAFRPDDALFDDVWKDFAATELGGSSPAKARILRAGRRIAPSERSDDAPDGWEAPSVRRYLERVVANEALLVVRARLLSLLSESRVAYTETAKDSRSRLLVISEANVAEQRDLVDSRDLVGSVPRPRARRLASFDAARYDRMRVLATELQRVVGQGGWATIAIGEHTLRMTPLGPRVS